MASRMNSFAAHSLCFLSLFLIISIQLVLAAEAQQDDDVYIVYTGALASSFHSDHIMTSSSIESWKDRVVHTYGKAFSGFAARLSQEEAQSIALRPEVISVVPDRPRQQSKHSSSDILSSRRSLVGLKPSQIPESNTTNNVSSVSGEDVIIGVFDTGIWPEAKSFNDEGLGPIPKKWKGKCVAGPDFKCNRKLIGARNYVPNENSPRDHNGHGTHVAAIAAGRPVPGATYHGLAAGTAQGGAPGARIAVYRVCGNGCWDSDILKAIDDAVADGVDIISLSFSVDSTVGTAAFHAAENGILVVASAGDGGAEVNPVLIDNDAPWILTVGATTTNRFFESDIVLGNNKVIKGGGVHTSNFQKKPVYSLIDGRSAVKAGEPESEASVCFRDSLDGNKVKGKIVLCESNLIETNPAAQLEEITRLGAIALLYLDGYGQLVNSVSDSIPRIAITSQDDYQIRAYINSTRNPVATILPTVVVSDYKPAPSVAYFSGRGQLLTNHYQIKPDIVAPGVDILSAWPSNVTNEAFNILSGTAMACAHVTGIAALLKSQHPTWTATAIKSAIITTANPTNNLKKPITNNQGDPATPYETGAGEVTTTFGSASQAGLVYETKVVEYLRYWCYSGYDESRIKLISSKFPANFSCPKNSKEEFISNMNYPSISIRQSSDQKYAAVKRTVTNVGDEGATYRVSVDMSQIKVIPTELKFTKNQKKLSYKVIATYDSSLNDFAYGSITWSNPKHNVRIPLIVNN